MNKANEAAPDSAFEIRFGQVGLAQMRVRSTDAAAIQTQLAARVAAAPPLLEHAAVCLDLNSLGHDAQAAEVRAVLQAIRQAGMLPVGLAHGTETVNALARSLDLPVLTQFRVQGKPSPLGNPSELAATPAAPASAAAEPFGVPALMHHRPVRSGQRIYARHRDLVLTSTVGAGAEVMADGCVHVYAPLRGRAMAGARGEVTARVFCREFYAELVSIAGVFKVFETIPAELAGKPVQAWLDGDDLRLARIGA